MARSIEIWARRAVLAAGLLAAQPVRAQTVEIPRDAIGQEDAAGRGLVAAFAQFCLDRFPGDGSVQAPPETVLTPLPPAALRELLHDDPGRGWQFVTPGGIYLLTIEDPPFHTCAVRRIYAKQPLYRLPWLRIIGGWAQLKGRGTFAAVRPMTTRQGSLTIEAAGQVLRGGAEDVFMELKTTYPDGQVEERLARRAVGR